MRGRAGLSITKLIPEAVALVVMATVLLFVQHQFSGAVEPWLLNAWLGFMALCIAGRLVSVGISLRSPNPEIAHALSKRGPGGQAITLGFCIGIVASVWILMPAADPMLRLIMIILCMWFIAMVIILNPDRAAVAGALAVVASMAAFALTYRIPYSVALAGFLLMEGAALVMIRQMSVRASRALEAALRIVQTERDAKTRFLAAASHDLQQPLQAARLYFDLLVSGEGAGSRDRAIAGARVAFANTQKLLESMLEHLRLEADAVAPTIASIPLRATVSSVALEHEPSLRAAGIEIRLVGRAHVLADDHMLRRIIGNLLSNVVKHSRANRVLIGIVARGKFVEVRIIDDGRGVAEEDADRLFDDYYQGAAAGGSIGGFGIGLSSSRRMAESMGGTLQLNTRWKAGCAFVLRLARGPDQGAPA